MTALICPCCGHVVPSQEIQRQDPTPAAVAAAIEVLAAHGRTRQLGAEFHQIIGTLRQQTCFAVAQ